MARPKSISLRARLVKLFPRSALDKLARSTRAVVRRRKVDIVDFVWNLVLGFGSGRQRTLAGLRRSFEKATGQTIEESSFYTRFNKGLVEMLRTMATEAFASLDNVGRELTGVLAQFKDLVVTDSTVMRLHDMLQTAFPACRTNHTKSALKMHAVLSVTGAGGSSLKITDARTHDGPVFRVGKWVRDRLLLFDLGYFRYQLFACITRNGGFFVSRLKARANPLIVSANIRHRGRARHVVGKRLREVISGLHREVLDVMVQVTFKRRLYGGRQSMATQILRVVGVRDQTTGEYHLYITNIPVERLSATDIAQVYAARWLVELLFKELKSMYRIEDLPSGKREVVESLVYASILTLVVSRTLLHAVRRKLADQARRMPLQRWARLFEEVARDLLLLVTHGPREAALLERQVTTTLLYESVDPSVGRPSLLQAVETRSHVYLPKAA